MVIDDTLFEVSLLTSGEPQGSGMGSLLFLTFINDMPAAIKSHYLLLANNGIVYNGITYKQNCVTCQEDLDYLQKLETD